MTTPRGFTALLVASVAFATLVSCGPVTTTTVRKPQLYEWNDDGGPGEVAIRINLETQRASYTRGGRPIGWSYVATGTPGHSTPQGTFRITEKVIDKYSNAYGWIEDEFGNVVNGDAQPSTPVPAGCNYVPAPMPYWMRLTDWGIGMHAGLIPNPGTPASHGCIRLPKPFAPVLFSVVNVGTPVKIVKEKPALPAIPVDDPSSSTTTTYTLSNPTIP
ncbi:L,D-transpeptidase family protein [Haloferula rosea]|uniref:L,D-transpeptidase family protein n=1 Tax=Haloferula rosea TaxID=490093 RepID=A0A934R7R5_9BACT|nr:L,D-transpeptidase family protein [Haloferula rosea]MBK1825488.1 L,D-transpeptidase family protein [Haloferula rosea]